MPLYPHSILKKPKSSSADLIQRSQVPTSKEPIDVDAHLFDRPVAQPGIQSFMLLTTMLS